MTWHNQEVPFTQKCFSIIAASHAPFFFGLHPPTPHPVWCYPWVLPKDTHLTKPPTSFAYPPEGRIPCFARPNLVHSKSSTTHQSQTISQSNCVTTSSSSGPYLAYLALTRIPTHIYHPQGHISHIWAHIRAYICWWHLNLAPAPVAAHLSH